jgi:hypothetical protein
LADTVHDHFQRIPYRPAVDGKVEDAQLRRIRRIDAWAQEQPARSADRPGADRAFVVHRTVADPRFVDVTIDPSDRDPASLYGDPRAANWAADGLARFVTARSWLSTWSEEHTHASAPSDLAGVKRRRW